MKRAQRSRIAVNTASMAELIFKERLPAMPDDLARGLK